MNELPPFSRLHLGDATGVKLGGVVRRNGTLADDKTPQPAAQSGKKPRPNEGAQPPAWSADPIPALAYISEQLRDPSSTTIAEWRRAVQDSMEDKVNKYQRRLTATDEALHDAHRKINEYVNQAKMRLPGFVSTPNQCQADEANYSPLATSDTPWEISKDIRGRWSTLVTKRAAIQLTIQKAATRKLIMSGQRQSRAAGVVYHTVEEYAAELADAIDQIVNDYPLQTNLLETLRQVITTFINDPSQACNYQLNYILMGNAGVGKTRMARLLAELFGKLGLLVYDEVVETYRSDFVAEYEGQTAIKTRALLEGNVEKVIFLDEAYMLTTWDDKTPRNISGYSSEAVGEMLTFLSNEIGSTCFIAAGYEKEMQKNFLPANPGLARRFTQMIWIPDYAPDAMVDIYMDALAEGMSGPGNVLKRDHVTNYFTEGAVKFLVQIITDQRKKVDRQNDDENQNKYRYPKLHALFETQAGAMMVLANETRLLVQTSERDVRQLGVSSSKKETWALGPEDVKTILESRLMHMLQEKDVELAMAEIMEIANRDLYVHEHKWATNLPFVHGNHTPDDGSERRKSKLPVVRP